MNEEYISKLIESEREQLQTAKIQCKELLHSIESRKQEFGIKVDDIKLQSLEVKRQCRLSQSPELLETLIKQSLGEIDLLEGELASAQELANREFDTRVGKLLSQLQQNPKLLEQVGPGTLQAIRRDWLKVEKENASLNVRKQRIERSRRLNLLYDAQIKRGESEFTHAAAAEDNLRKSLTERSLQYLALKVELEAKVQVSEFHFSSSSHGPN